MPSKTQWQRAFFFLNLFAGQGGELSPVQNYKSPVGENSLTGQINNKIKQSNREQEI
jgi:hypothetical protein